MNYALRRKKLQQLMGPKSCAIIVNPQPARRSADQEYKYRPDNHMIYLCGLPEPGAVAVIFSEEYDNPFRLFVQPRDPEIEKWTGPMLGLEGAVEQFDADLASPVDSFNERLVDILFSLENVYIDFDAVKNLSKEIIDTIFKLRHRRRRAAEGPEAIRDLHPIVSEMRRIKDADEIDAMRKAAEISTYGFIAAKEAICPGMYEYEVEAVVNAAFRRNGAMGTSFDTIVATGANATTLHYTANDCQLKNGDLILIDAGAEYQYYAGDISRTFPVNGRMTGAQADLYAVVLEAQRLGIDAMRVGNHIMSSHLAVRRHYAQALRSLGFFAESPDAILEQGLDLRFYMHGTSHYLGLDTHDVGRYYSRGNDEPIALEPGVVMTVEPGLYIAPDDENAPKQFRGIGIRIEDDILVTDGDPEVLTASLPK